MSGVPLPGYRLPVAGLLLLFTLTVCCATEPPPIRWVSLFGGPFHDEARMVIEDGWGGFVAAGTAFRSPSQSSLLYIVHVDGLGRPIWEQLFDYGLITKAKDVYRIPDQGYLVTGYRVNYDGSRTDGLVLLLNNQGELIWDVHLDTPMPDIAWRSRPVGDGYVTIGITEDNPEQRKNGFVARISADGHLQGWRQYGSLRGERTTTFTISPEGNYLLAGLTRDTQDNSEDGWLLCVDASGDSLWSRSYGGPDHEEFYWIEPIPGGGYILCGATRSFHGHNNYDTWVVRIDEDGNQVDSNTFGNPFRDDWAQMVQVDENGYILAGFTGLGELNRQIYLARLNYDLEVEFIGLHGEEGIDMAYAVRVLDDGSYLLAGKATREGNLAPDLFVSRTVPRDPTEPNDNQTR